MRRFSSSKKTQQEGDVHGALLAAGDGNILDGDEVLAIGRQVEHPLKALDGVRHAAIGPAARFATIEGIAAGGAIRHHNAVVGSAVKELAAIARPEGIFAAAGGDMPFAAAGRSAGMIRAHIDLGGA